MLTLTLSDILRFEIGMLTIFSPPVAISIYATTLHVIPPLMRRTVALRLFIGIALTLVGSVWVGRAVLGLLGVTVPALTITGALVLLTWAIPMMLGLEDNSERAKEKDVPAPHHWQSMLPIPLLFPMSIGAAAISLVIATGARFDTPPDLAALSLVLVAHAGLIAATYLFTAPFSRRMGPMGMEITKRISGIVLTAISVQMLATALRELLPGLARQ
jgi:multiple antibiotic resistance protein